MDPKAVSIGISLGASSEDSPQSEQQPLPLRPHKQKLSLWPTVFSMCSATLGAGALSLPYAVEQVGAAGGVLMLLLTSAASHYSTVLLVSAIVQTGTRSYEELTVRLFGRTMGAITEVAIVLFCYGSAIAYTMALGDLVHPFASPLGLDQRTTICLIWLFLMLPLSLVEKISQLHWPSLFGVLSVIYLVLSVVAHACLCAVQEFTIASAAAPTASAASAGLERIVGGEDGRMYLFAWGPSSMEAVAIALFAFTCQVNVPALFAELEEEAARSGAPAPPPSQLLFPAAAEGPYSTPPQPHMEQRTQRQTPQHQQQPNPQQKQQQELLPVTKRSEPMKKVSFRAMCICLTCYLLVGLAGYRDAPSSPNGNLLKNYCVVASTHSLVPTHSSSRLMAPASLAMAVSVLMAYPFNIHPCRYTLDVMLFPHFGAVRSAARHIIWTFLIAGSGLLVSLYVPGINVVFQLMGSTCSAFVCFILPASYGLMLQLPEASGVLGRIACVALLFGGATVGVLATASTIAGLMEGGTSNAHVASAMLDVCDRRTCHA